MFHEHIFWDSLNNIDRIFLKLYSILRMETNHLSIEIIIAVTSAYPLMKTILYLVYLIGSMQVHNMADTYEK